MPPIRRVLVLAVDGVQSLDVMGPIETFSYANQQVPGAYRIDVVGPARDGQITMSNGLKLGVDPLPEPPPRHDTLVVAGGEGARRASRGPGDLGLDRTGLASRAAHHVDLHGLLPAGGRGPARRAARNDALELLHGAGPALPRGGDRPRPRVRPRRRRLDLGRRDRGDGPRAGAGRRRSRRGGGAGGRADAGRVLQASRRPVAVQRRAVGPAGLAAGAARVAGVDRRPPRRGPLGRRPGRPRGSQRALLRARLPRRSRRRRRRSTSRACASNAPARCWKTAPSRWTRSPGPPASRAPRCCAAPFTGAWV